MTKLDLALISQLGHDRAVPKEMDLHMVKYIVGQRKTAVERAVANNDNSPFVMLTGGTILMYFTLSEHTSIDLVGIPLCILIL
jgi:hypothetical protein